MLDRAAVEARLARHDPSIVSEAVARRRAAVAIVLRDLGAGPEVLMMKRASHPQDRWSGHVSFPGGRVDPEDASAYAAAVREAREELGLALEAEAQALGRTDDLMAVAQGKVLPMAITPFVFWMEREVELVLSSEAEASFWLPLRPVIDGSIADTMVYRLGPLPLDLPCWRWEGHVIWGLTHKMLTRFLEIVR